MKVGNKIIRNLSDRRGLINYLPQDNFLPDNTSIKTIINLFLDKDSRPIVLANDFIKPLLNKKNQDLSGGEKRIVEIILLIHSKAAYILLDEPFKGLSPIVREYIVDYINKTRVSKGFIITDHDHKSVMNLADRLVYLREGFLKEVDLPLPSHSYGNPP